MILTPVALAFVSECPLGGFGAEVIANELHRIDFKLSALDLSRKFGVENLTKSPVLLWFYALLESGCDLGDRGAEFLGEALVSNSTLTCLRVVSGCHPAAFIFLRASRLPYTTGNDIKEAGARRIAEALQTNQSLKDLDLSGERTGHGWMCLCYRDCLPLSFSICDTFVSLCLLSYLTVLSFLISADNMIGAEGGKAFVEIVKLSTALLSLDLGRT